MKKNDNVIPFPKDQTIRARLRERGANQKAVLALSILSILMISVFSNQMITRPEQQAAGRGIASLGPLQSQADVKWEHRMARELSQQRGLAAHLAVKPSLRDDLIYGSLQGRYAMRLDGDRVSSLEFIRNERSDAPLAIRDRGALLTKYRAAFAVPFQEVSLVKTEASEEVWNLIGSDKTIVGTAKVGLDGAGHMTSLSVK